MKRRNVGVMLSIYLSVYLSLYIYISLSLSLSLSLFLTLVIQPLDRDLWHLVVLVVLRDESASVPIGRPGIQFGVLEDQSLGISHSFASQ
jgi:hypothetical protein